MPKSAHCLSHHIFETSCSLRSLQAGELSTGRWLNSINCFRKNVLFSENVEQILTSAHEAERNNSNNHASQIHRLGWNLTKRETHRFGQSRNERTCFVLQYRVLGIRRRTAPAIETAEMSTPSQKKMRKVGCDRWLWSVLFLHDL